MNQQFPVLEPTNFSNTRNALHAYSKILGRWASTSRARRKHWWHASLRPSLTGVTTNIVYTDSVNFEMVLDIRNSALCVSTSIGEQFNEKLHGQPTVELATKVGDFLSGVGVSEALATTNSVVKAIDQESAFVDYSADEANKLARALAMVSAALSTFRAGIREETSPISVWPHHFDLAMLWLPGPKVSGQDLDAEEYADKQMNFGFTFGDENIPEPYFYVTAYPLPDQWQPALPAGTIWHTEGFNGATLPYRTLIEETAPSAYLLDLWKGLLAHGEHNL